MNKHLAAAAILSTLAMTIMLLTGCEDGRNGPQGDRGARGEPGSDAPSAPPSPYDITEIIEPCPESSDEVLLRLYDGTILGHYSQGSRQYLTELTEGTYQTTDGSKCNFTINADGSVGW